MSWTVKKDHGFYLPEIDWYLDSTKPVARSFASHAHFDHLGKHESILCTPATAHLAKLRLGGQRQWIVHDFEEPFNIAPGVTAKLYPAGHILGSAMLWMEKDGTSFLYTGDFNLSRSILAEDCVVPKADVLLTETTFGNPRYLFPAAREVVADIATFCRDTLANGDTPAIFTYSLGKCQEVLKGLQECNLQLMLHPKAFEMTRACEALGEAFPAYGRLDKDAIDGHVLIGPPPQGHSQWTGGIDRLKTAMISGWAIDSSATYRYRCDKAFPLSDHSDYLDLKAFVSKVDPQLVYTTHGFDKEFASDLRESGYQAYALGEENQLSLKIESTTTPEAPPPTSTSNDGFSPTSTSNDGFSPTSLEQFSQVVQSTETTGNHQEKTAQIQSYLKKLDTKNRALAAHYLIGRNTAKPMSQPFEIDRTTIKQAVLSIAGKTDADYKTKRRELTDAEETLAYFLSQANGSSPRSLTQVDSFLSTLAAAPNPIFRQSFLAEELRKISPKAGITLIRIILGTGISDASERCVEHALANLVGCSAEQLRQAHLRCGNISKVAAASNRSELDAIPIAPFFPLAPMSINTQLKADAIVATLGNEIWVEDKYDGIRCQIHKSGEHVELYDRGGKNITLQFPEIVEASRLIPQDFIGDGALIPWQDERPLPASSLQTRLNRHGEDLFLGEEIPVIYWLFDLLWLNGATLLDLPLKERKEGFAEFTVNATIRIAPTTPIQTPQELAAACLNADNRGNAGIVAKSPKGQYTLGQASPDWFAYQE